MKITMRKAPLLNLLFGTLNILEVVQRSFYGDSEASTHSLYAAGYNFTQFVIPYLPSLKSKKNLDKKYVNGISTFSNLFGYVIDWFHKHTFVSRVDTWKSYESRLYSRSISYLLLPLQQTLTITANACELWKDSKNA